MHNQDIRYGRKRRGIKRQLHKKIEEWLSTIDDAEVQAVARKHAICTGGSIANMLIGEPINDYDIYFSSKDATAAVAKYYVDKFNRDNQAPTKDGVGVINPLVKVLDDRVTIWMQSAGIAAEGQSEYEYFESSPEDRLVDFVESTVIDDSGKEPYRPVFMSENAITLANSVQLITRFFGDPEEIHKNFDFQHAKCWWEHEEQKLVLPAESLECLLSRTLIYTGSLYPVASVFRTKKFITRGWRITAGQQLKIIWQISELDLKDHDVIREQLTGVDMAYLHELINALKDIDPEKCNSTYIAEIIDRIFED